MTRPIVSPRKIPRWTRGEEWGKITTERYTRKMAIMALGTSVGTNQTAWTSDVIVVRSFDDLDARAAEGKVSQELI